MKITISIGMLSAALALTACAQQPAQDSPIEAIEEEVQTMFRSINEKVSVSPQITLEDVAAAKAEGGGGKRLEGVSAEEGAAEILKLLREEGVLR